MMELGVRAVEEGDACRRKEKRHEFAWKKVEIEHASVHQKSMGGNG